jgi:hypothetical protein
VSDDAPPPLTYARYADFLDADCRRRGDALELGHDWRGGRDRFRVCWYVGTGELTAERLSREAPLDLEDFHRGVVGPVEVIGRFATRGQLDRALGAWPNTTPGKPRTLAWLRRALQGHATP